MVILHGANADVVPQWTRAVIYARYSSDHQREASIEDQTYACRAEIERRGWTCLASYTDHALSGASAFRPGYQKLLEDARSGAFEVIVAEALDRLSRDQADIAALYRELSFLGIRLVTVADGAIDELHVGLKGTMNALFLKDLAQKTRRGLAGRIREGRSGGGLSYGYRVVREIDANGEPVFGKRAIEPDEAGVVRRIFGEYADGRSPRDIAVALNRDGIAGPRGQTWNPSTIYGNWRRGTGILNNELYAGRLVWNRQRYVKDPASGRRQARPNPEAEWLVEEVPELRIVDEALWDRVKARQQGIRREIAEERGPVRPERARRPRYLFSGLLRCGVCGASYTLIGARQYGCSGARNRGTCDNRRTMSRHVLEASVLNGLKEHLLHPDLVHEFVREYQRAYNASAAGREAERDANRRALEKAERQIRSIIEAIKDGLRTASMGEELKRLEARKAALKAELARPAEPLPRLHPGIADVYRRKVADLTAALTAEETQSEAAEIIRGLVEEIRLVPREGALGIYLVGDLAGILGVCTSERPGLGGTGAQVTLVAGAGFEPATFRL